MIKVFLRNASPEIEVALALKIKSLASGSAGRIESTRARRTLLLAKSEGVSDDQD